MRSGVVFRCEKCDLNMDIECVLRHKTINHFSHGHPLTLSHKKDDDGACCRACGKKCSGATYSCNRCSFCLHESCGELQREIHHELHEHPLTLFDKSFRCDACLVESNGFTYNCSSCNFNLHVECTSLAPSIKYEGHDEHLLTFVSHVYGKPPCHVCDSKYSWDYKYSGDPKYSNISKYCGDSYLRCVKCDFNVHLMCVPLPCVIEHPCHTDPLVLKDCHIDDASEGQEYICDVLDCELERDPRECVYYCEECDFVAQLGCVLGELLPLLQGKCGNVEWKKVDRDVAVKLLERKFISFNDILNSFDEDDKKEMDHVLSSFRRERDIIFNNSPEDHLSNYANNFFKYHSYLDEAFFRFAGTIEPRIPLELTINGLEIVKVGNHEVTKQLKPVLEKLIEKYGDFTADSTLKRPNVKTYHLVMFCHVVHSMCNTKVMNINADLLRQWWINCKLAQRAGFKIQFAFESLNKVAYVRFTLVSELHAGAILDQYDDRITEYSNRIMECRKQLEELKEKRVQHVSSTRFAESSQAEGFLREALALRLNTAMANML
ncbi:uncharacterized protein LOC110819249 [Carica papaya]|uniref:uncharacterized protein LOC110819249 n=1 Tax=Carica papaya TaxID=3649 RepID=UPI000B8D10BC|nr:uncharacterized protein LOC110819249 [Carica papaya]